MSLVESVQKTIAEQGLIKSGELALVAVSGGPDSTALLHGLQTLGYEVEAGHLHHGIRGQEADDDAEYVQGLCRKLAIPLHIARRDVPALRKDSRLSIQQAARQARYEFLAETAGRAGAGVIATAHTRDDRIETVLLNILRGTGVEGLRGIPYRRGPFIRPLLDTSRSDVESYCDDHGLSPRRDSSNLSSAYSRNNVRRELIPYLERRYNGSVQDALLRLSEIASAESDYLVRIARDWIAGRCKLPAPDLHSLPVALQRRVLREWIRERRPDDALVNIGHETIEAIRQAATGPFAITLPGGEWIASGDGTTLTLTRLTRPEEVQDAEIPVQVPDRLGFFEWSVEVAGDAKGVDAGSLCIRNWRPGDRIRLPGGSKKLQDIFTDAKVARNERRTWPVVADKNGPLVVANLAADLRADGLAVKAERNSSEGDR